MDPDRPTPTEFFDRGAGRYADGNLEASVRKQYEWPAVRSLLPDVADKRVLDAGCGPGTAAARLAEQGADVLGVDTSEELLRIAEDRHGDHVEFKQADLGEPLEFVADATVDVVLSQLTLDFIEDWGPVFREFSRVLSTEGVVVFSVNHPFHDYLAIEYRSDTDIDIDTTNYFAVDRYYQNWGTDEDPDRAPFYRRPLREVIQPPLNAGFVVDGLVEPIPDEAAEHLDTFRENPPRFLCVGVRQS